VNFGFFLLLAITDVFAINNIRVILVNISFFFFKLQPLFYLPLSNEKGLKIKGEKRIKQSISLFEILAKKTLGVKF